AYSGYVEKLAANGLLDANEMCIPQL
ncbi:MAG: hypothetical protein ACJAS4_003987, partial [Bacteriovoracaceae bacterium]